MENLNFADIAKLADEYNILYQPSNTTYYKKYLFKIDLNDNFKIIKNGAQRSLRVVVTINMSDLSDIDKKFDDAKHRLENLRKAAIDFKKIKTFLIDEIGASSYKMRLGKQEKSIYLENPEAVSKMLSKFSQHVGSIKGPINEEHEKAIYKSKKNHKTVIKDKLLYKKYRFVIQFKFSKEFADYSYQLEEHLKTLDKGSWKISSLNNVRIYYQYNPKSCERLCSKVTLYLKDVDDFLMIKMMASEHIAHDYEIIVTSELA